MNLNTYLGRGMNDYLYAKKSMESGDTFDYNWPVVICAQAVEKLLKAVIETRFAEDGDCIGLMKTHNLRTIINKIKEKYPLTKLSSKDCKWLGDFYFDARYPGDDFIVVTEEDARESIAIVEDTLCEIEKILLLEEEQQVFAYGKKQLELMK